MLFMKNKLFPIPNIFCITSFSYHMYMYRFVFMAKKHECKPECSKYFRHVILFFCLQT